ncbi:MAG: amino acid permease, partial [Chloroflexi bacterium]
RIFTGPLAFMYPVFQLSTLFILVLAANTSYSDFPRLASLLARDHYLPHQFAFRGDRLAFSTGIVFLALLASSLLIVFKGDTTALINLYAVGVFISFTLSQAGMVRHWWHLRHEHRGWLRSMVINGIGAFMTLLVAVVISSTKFFDGAWVVVFLIPLLVLMLLGIRSHYLRVERERTTDLPVHPDEIRHRLIVPLGALNPATQQSLAYARSISPHVTAIHIKEDPHATETLLANWEAWQASLPEDEWVQLDVVEPERRSVVHALLNYIHTMHQQHPEETLTVIVPEIAESSWLLRLVTHPKSFHLKAALFFHPEIVVTNVARYRHHDTMPLLPRAIRHRFIVPIAELDRATVQSLAYARSISPHVVAVHVAIDPHDVAVIRDKWQRLQKHLAQEEETSLVIIESPYRSLTRPLLAYVETMRELHAEETLTVILPEFVVAHWWEFPLHNQTALQLKTAFLTQPSIVVTDIPQHLVHKTEQRAALV